MARALRSAVVSVSFPPAPVASGLLLALSLPPFPGGALAFVALIPFALHTSRLPPGAAGRRGAARAGLWLGVAYFAVLLHWIPFSVPGRPGMAVAAYCAAIAFLALAPALVGGLLHGLVRGAACPLWIALPLAWTVGEWARGVLPGGLAFPWGGVALSLTGTPRALSLLPWTGELGVSFWIALVNGLLACAWVGRPARRAVARGAAALGVAALPWALAAPGPPSPRAGTRDGGGVRVAVVQTAVPVSARADPVTGADAMAAALERILGGLEAGSVDLVALPETAFPLRLESPEGGRYLGALRDLSLRLGAPLLVGALAATETAPPRPLNSLFLVDGSGVVGRYDKRHLVPVIERNPLLGSRMLTRLGDRTSYEAGERRAPLDVGGVRVGALICFESAFASLAGELRSDGAQLLVNATNDAWFAHGPGGRAARAQHEAHARLRALETRLPLVRASNGGRSMWIDDSGTARAVARPGEEGVQVARVAWTRGAPSGLRIHGAVGPACALAAALLLLASLRRPLPKPGPDEARP